MEEAAVQSIGIAFLGGLIASLSACVYPLIPIITAIFGAAQVKNWAKGFSLSLIYVLGMSITYVTLGIAASLGGSVFGAYMGNKWVIISFALIFFFLGLWFIEIIPIRLPNFAEKLQVKNKNIILYPLLLGIFSGFIAAPCTAPLFGALLTDIAIKAASDQSILPGAIRALAFSLGMGLPFLLIGGFAIRLPKPGKWMQIVKYLGAVILFTAGYHYLQDLTSNFPPRESLAAIAVTGFFIFIVFFILSDPLSSPDIDKSMTKPQILTYLMIAAFGLFLATSPLANQTTDINEKSTLKWYTSLDEGISQAEKENTLVIIDFWAEWCTACHEMDEKLFKSKEFEELVKKDKVVLIRLDFTDETESNLNLSQKYDIKGLPTVVLTDKKGEKLTEMIGFYSKEHALTKLERALRFYKSQM
ncbi:MAG: thioredoxin family protein [Spirochaetia bacterium]|nr:thioredoxin family protein [Spirochaetia bacterium]